MPDILDKPPADVGEQLDALGAALTRWSPPSRVGNLLIGTWNIRDSIE